MRAFPKSKTEEPYQDGMELRDYFAAKATKEDVEPFLKEATEKIEGLFPEHLGGNNWTFNGKRYTQYKEVKKIKEELVKDSNVWVTAKFLYADAMMEARQ